MDLDKKVENLAGEMASMKKEFDQTRAGLRELLDRLGSPMPGDSSLITTSRSPDAPAQDSPKSGRRTQVLASWAVDEAIGKLKPERGSPRAEAARGPSGKVKGGVRKGGGLSLSRAEFDLMLAEVRTALSQRADGDNQAGKTGLSLESLARSWKKAQAGAGQITDAAGREDGVYSLSLADLAQRLKEAQTSASEHAKTGGRNTRNIHSLKGSLQSAASGKPAATRKAALHPLAGGGSSDRLDINLVANLMRWVGSVKRRFGLRQMQDLLDTYRLTRHLTPIIDKTILHLARLPTLPEESADHTSTVDALIDATLELHGIVYGSGRAPIGPTVEFDYSETSLSASSQSGTDSGGRIEDFLATPMDEEARKPSGKEIFELELPDADFSAEEHEEAPPIFQTTTPQHADVPVTASIGEQPSDRRHSMDDAHEGGAAYGASAIARHPYPTDLTDAEWRRMELLVPSVKPGGRPGKYERREILNGIRYHLGVGCSWRSLPNDLPPWKIVHHYFRTWRADGTWDPIIEALDGQRSESEYHESESPAWPNSGILPQQADNAVTEVVTRAIEAAVAASRQ